MQINKFLILSLALIFARTLAGPQFQAIPINQMWNNPPEYSISNTLIFGLDTLDLSTGAETPLTIASECGSDLNNFVFTSNLNLWCYLVAGNTAYIYQLDLPELSEAGFNSISVNNYPISVVNENNILFLTENYKTSFSVLVFNAPANAIVCNVGAYDIPTGSQLVNFFYTGKNFVYATLSQDVITFNYEFCTTSASGVATTYPSIQSLNFTQLYNFTTAGIMVYVEPVFSKTQVVAFNYLNSGSMVFGSEALPVMNVSRIDSLFFFTMSIQGNNYIGNISYIGSNLDIVTTHSFIMGVTTGPKPEATVVQGNNTIIVQLDSQTYYIYNIGQQGIIEVVSPYSTQTFANGSIFVITNYGYFFNSKGTTFTYHPYTFNIVGQVPIDASVIWAISYTPGMSNCSASYFSPYYNIILPNNDYFPKCPPFTTGLQLLDAVINSRGYPILAFGAPYSGVSIVFLNGSLLQYNQTQQYSTYQVALNTSINGGFIMGSNGATIDIIVFHFFGTVATQSISGGSQNFIEKLNEQYMAIAINSNTYWTVMIYNLFVMQATVTQQISTTLPINPYDRSPLIVLGFNPSASPICQGFALIGNNQVVIAGNSQVNNDGISTYSASVLLGATYSSTANGFIINVQNSSLYTQQYLINVTSWGSASSLEY